eukprot:CAMPEP_0172678582 /NCGR_PEP_ID=MMETSP1074-20121228/15511_1 /TAXON_ID=2916 /ORGANISM="Ceratium fusus, Strain PA161109" /LENGTH=49 /DNA_ID= /DNA_START= /DNA_END= /DNA_ORIENTATION=
MSRVCGSRGLMKNARCAGAGELYTSWFPGNMCTGLRGEGESLLIMPSAV